MIIIDCLTESGGWLGKLTALSTLGLLLVTAFYAVQTKRTVDLMKKQNEIENKYKNTDLWDRALNEFFIPFEQLIAAYEKEIQENQQPSVNSLTQIRQKMSALLRYWSYRVLKDKEYQLIRRYLDTFMHYEQKLANGNGLSQNEKTILLNDCDSIITEFMKEIRSLKKRLRYDSLDDSNVKEDTSIENEK